MPDALPIARVRTLLVLGRVSNLPTVWSNCLAAWLLAGGRNPGSLLSAACAGSLLYTGGMFLNDAFDVEFDRRFRPERPIVSGQIAARTVWIFGVAMLVLGLLLWWKLGRGPGLWGSFLAGAVVLYDAIHKKTALAPVLMASCRVLLYFAAASVVGQGSMQPVALPAAILAAYIVGLSLLARVESNSGLVGGWPYALLALPIPGAFMIHKPGLSVVLSASLFAAWLTWCLLPQKGRLRSGLGVGISGLLAGIVLVDLLAVSPGQPARWALFAALFAGALVFQRLAPAT